MPIQNNHCFVKLSQHVPKTTPPPSPSHDTSKVTTEEGQDEVPKAELDLCTGPKDAYVVEVHMLICDVNTNVLSLAQTFGIFNRGKTLVFMLCVNLA